MSDPVRWRGCRVWLVEGRGLVGEEADKRYWRQIRSLAEVDPDQCLDLRIRAALRTTLRGADLHGADLRGAYLQGADLSSAVLQGADLAGAYLRDANLRGADLRGAYLQGAVLRGADVRSTRF